MASIAINRFNARYRIPLPALHEQARLQRILTDAIEHVVEDAVDRRGIGRSGYLCIRDLHASVRVKLREPDALLAEGLGETIARAIAGAVDAQSPSIVQYSSRPDALIDLATHAVAGNFDRSWAWSQVGIWRSDFPLNPVVAVDRVMRTLAVEATHAAAVIAHLARRRTEVFTALTSRATPAAWIQTANAALRAAGAGGNLADVAVREWRQAPPDTVALRIARESVVARVSAAEARGRSPEITLALAAFALLEIEPAVFRAAPEGQRQRLAAVARMMDGAPLRDPIALRSADASDSHQPETQADQSARDRDRALSERPSTEIDRWEERTRDGGDPRSVDRDTGAETRRTRNVERHDAESGESVDQLRRAGGPDVAAADDPLASIAADGRVHATTQLGGLLYLINLAGTIGLSETILADERVSDRGPRWVLHQIAMRLTGCEPSDSAALVFAGLLPDAPPPSSLQALPTAVELEAVRDHRAALARALRERLERHDEPDEALLEFVCVRRAAILADPGWIDVQFAVTDVSTDIRRAGLDRDPGWVPWLGLAVRFIYA